MFFFVTYVRSCCKKFYYLYYVSSISVIVLNFLYHKSLSTISVNYPLFTISTLSPFTPPNYYLSCACCSLSQLSILSLPVIQSNLPQHRYTHAQTHTQHETLLKKQ